MDTLSSLSEKITSAEIAQKKWGVLPLNTRIDFVNKFNNIFLSKKKEFVNLLISEVYKPKIQAEDEVVRTYDMTLAFCEEARGIVGEIRESGGYRGNKNNKIAIIKRQPLGTVLCISPFNYPVNESLAKIIPAILMGNAVLFKPASVATKIGELIEKCFLEIKFPEGIFSLINVSSNVVPAPFSNGVNSGRILKNEYQDSSLRWNDKKGGIRENPNDCSLINFVVSHPLIDCINFTGSTETAEHISSICGIKKLVMGLSGKDASIVCVDADVDLAVSEIVSGAFSYSGQRCTGVKKVLVSKKIYAEFVEKLKLKIKMSLIAGKLTDEKTNFGPMLEEKHFDFIEELLVDAENLGGKVEKIQIMGKEWAENEWGKKFILPTVVSNVTREMRLAWEEPFAPVLPVLTFEHVDEAVLACNQSAYGLQNSVFTSNIHLAFKIAERLECGVVNINGKDARGPDNFPFLGVKKSGLGVVGGVKYLLNEMSTLKSVVVNMK